MNRQSKAILLTSVAVSLIGLRLSPTEAYLSPPAAIAGAEVATKALNEGRTGDAIAPLRAALLQNPDALSLNLLAGVTALQCGDYHTAQTAFERASLAAPEEALSKYGEGLAQLAQGKMASAKVLFERARKLDPDRKELQEAENYLHWLEGTEWTGESMQNTASPLQRLTQGLDAANRNGTKAAYTTLTGLYNEGIDSGVNSGIKATGIALTPMTVLAVRSVASMLPKPQNEAGAIKGYVQITAEDVNGYSYVGFEIDGQSLGLVSSNPYTMNWNTRNVSNGVHELSIVFYDSSGNESRRTQKTLRVRNLGIKETLSENLKETLWKTLTLSPDPGTLAFAIGNAERKAGKNAEAQRWYWTVLARNPQSLSARKALVQTGGLLSPKTPLYAGRPGEKLVALTFDDGPKPGMTEALLDFLVREKIPATFFVIGRHVDANPELTRKIAIAGMEMANHSYTHRNLTRLSGAELAGEMAKTQAAIIKATGKAPVWMRPPGGNWNNAVAQTVKQWGLTPCFWTVDVYGSEVLGTQQVAEQTLSQVKPGSIVLMHNGKMSTLQALPTILKELKRRGYHFVTVSELNARLQAAPSSERTAILVQHTGKKRRGE